MYWTILFAKDRLVKVICKKICATTNNVCAMYGVQRGIVVVEELPNRCYETSEHLLALPFQGQPLRFTIIIVIQHISAFHGKPCVFIIIFLMNYASAHDIVWTGTFWD